MILNIMKSNATNVNNADDSVKESYNVDVTKYYKQVSIVTSLVVLVAMVITPIVSTIILTCLVGVSFLLLKNVQNKFPSNIMLLIVFVVFWSISVNLLCCNLSLQHVISTWAISIGVCIAGLLVGMIIEIDLTKYIIPQGIYTLVCLFVSKILAFILYHQNNQSVSVQITNFSNDNLFCFVTVEYAFSSQYTEA
ncbi:hypothetical protein KSF78_0004583 [Schistosoma japonicum]|nr:hypothetical protein KSF78_0004583 [Schistosoma japonicum]